MLQLHKDSKPSPQHKAPFTVPDGYFDEFRSRMASSLPPYPEEPKPQPLSRWQRWKPYVYLAAMFAGIWCMMQMFHMISSSEKANFDNPPEAVVLAVSDNDTYEYIIDGSSSESDFEVEQDVSEMYPDFESFEKDFGVTIRPEYDKISID